MTTKVSCNGLQCSPQTRCPLRQLKISVGGLISSRHTGHSGTLGPRGNSKRDCIAFSRSFIFLLFLAIFLLRLSTSSLCFFARSSHSFACLLFIPPCLSARKFFFSSSALSSS